MNKKIPFSFGVDGDGNYGYYGADDSLIPFKSDFSNATLLTSVTGYDGGKTLDYTADKDKYVLVVFATVNVQYSSERTIKSTTGEILFDINASHTASNTTAGSRVALVKLKAGQSISCYIYAYSHGTSKLSYYELT